MTSDSKPVCTLILFAIVAAFCGGHGSAIVCAQTAGTQRVGVARLTPEVRTAISKGLTYLAKSGIQNKDGSWGGTSNPVAETSLSLMAFLLKGHVPGRGRYGGDAIFTFADDKLVLVQTRGQAENLRPDEEPVAQLSNCNFYMLRDLKIEGASDLMKRDVSEQLELVSQAIVAGKKLLA